MCGHAAQAQHSHEQVGEQHTLGVGGTLLTVRCCQAGVLAQQHGDGGKAHGQHAEQRDREGVAVAGDRGGGGDGRKVARLDGHGFKRDDEELGNAQDKEGKGQDRGSRAVALEKEEQAGHERGDDGPLEQDAQGVDPGKVVVGRDLHAQQRKDAGEQQAQDGGDERAAHKGTAQAGELAGGGGGIGSNERENARGDAVAGDAGPGAAGENGIGQDEHHKGERLVLCDEAHGAPNSQKDLEQTEGDAPGDSALGNGARLCLDGLDLT